MNVPIAIKIECAKGEILNAIESICRQHDLQPCLMDGVISSVLAEIRAQGKIELLNATNSMLREKDEEIEEVKRQGKKVLETDPESKNTDVEAGKR